VTLPRTPSFRLDGRRALVSGASSGIGLGAAAALAGAGAEVTLAARSAERLDAIAAEMAAGGMAARPLPLDVTDVAATAAAVAAAGPFDILVNSAGLARHTPAVRTTEADFDAVAGLNLRAAYFLTRAVAEGLIAAGRPGSLITVSSQMGRVGGPERAVYCATKHAVEGFTKAMAIEWGGHGIRVNCVAPTFVSTPLAAQTLSDPDRRAWVMSKIRLGRLAEVEDVMGAILLLASDAGAMITGSSLLIDGGWTAG
jgi:NAD(P)-dependent dehydrogenase (short-subunit alcohol dehydrogenase family)